MKKATSASFFGSFWLPPRLFAQKSKLKANKEKPEKGNQVKRMHPHALKLILQGKKKETIAYLEGTSGSARVTSS